MPRHPSIEASRLWMEKLEVGAMVSLADIRGALGLGPGSPALPLASLVR